ncbi:MULTISPECIES: autotransporter outer membrane beta-barrel domain-containing protein [unclassified Pseudomonas]|jgi:outer membrane autotransporter protein|uniref:autotransporter outer membrane beta-barrel domain-containing protein n=1 Tax=unclassified Pseudomonas TaxID=196821 RepID=UPI000C869843|nr:MULTISPECIES: autotransporter outer membrane beta-barrel domain-containing protein [unclassified Pseudomonas]PMV18561.1 autotransporter outer membrane beta-barrel domain-containing protein [Pseudomonas sp. FW305-3-2-15-C-TSA2]PMV21288.1 autotransporter outer membrane beta-barrel domain-containing protein [Pseudomonas sp. DP16D-L5]PMV34344.1 autotransporter outer membrane beta-barrel domain-containing protein [Pseudomonas sp. FW305-3-2-15-A-LB2]PMV39698.1 autotransporter outer membrane beta-b
MNTHVLFKRSRLSAAIKILAIAPFSLVATHVSAVDLGAGQKLVIDAGSDFDRYTLKDGAQLISNGAAILSVASQNSTFEMNGGEVVAGSEHGVQLYGSQATIRDAHISSASGIGMIVGEHAAAGSHAQVSNSRIEGATYGVNLGRESTLQMTSTDVLGGEFGILAIDGNLAAQGGSITGGTNGLYVYRTADGTTPASFHLEGTRVVGETGAAIVVDSPGVGTTPITIANGTTLEGGNGNMLEVINGGAADVLVNNSNLAGNIQVGSGSALDLNLDFAAMKGDIINNGGTANAGLNNGAVLTGRLENVDKLSVNSDATWVLVDGQDELKELSMNGGNVKFGDSGAFYQLNVTNLNGTGGTFIMKADFSTLTGDFLNVTGTSSGAHQLLIASTGADPLSDDRLHVVRTADGGASFSLVGGRVDVGTYSYGLVSDNRDHDWYLDPDNKVISPSTHSVLALANAAPSVLYGEMTNLRTRMGELRHSDGKSSGMWSRTYGNKFEVNNRDKGVQYNQAQRGFTLGADVPLSGGDGQWLAGFLAGHSTSDLDLNRGSKATVNSYYAGGYATWLDAESGFYFDGVLKFNRLHNESNVAMSDGRKAKGNYTQNAVTASAEVGRHIKLDDGFFVEPYGQLATAIIQRQSYELDNGLQAKGARTASVVGKAGVTAGRDIQLDGGSVLQPYLRTAVAHEFNQSNKVSVNGNSFNNDLSGTRVEIAAGLAMAVSKNWKVHADVERSMGKSVDQPWGVNVGVRYDF